MRDDTITGHAFCRFLALVMLKEFESVKLQLNAQWRLKIFKAWQDNKPLWGDRYEVENEADLRTMLAPTDEADYPANYQQNPIPPDSDFVKRNLHHERTIFNADAHGVAHLDPNLSKKGKGDTTAIVALFYDQRKNK